VQSLALKVGGDGAGQAEAIRALHLKRLLFEFEIELALLVTALDLDTSPDRVLEFGGSAVGAAGVARRLGEAAAAVVRLLTLEGSHVACVASLVVLVLVALFASGSLITASSSVVAKASRALRWVLCHVALVLAGWRGLAQSAGLRLLHAVLSVVLWALVTCVLFWVADVALVQLFGLRSWIARHITNSFVVVRATAAGGILVALAGGVVAVPKVGAEVVFILAVFTFPALAVRAFVTGVDASGALGPIMVCDATVAPAAVVAVALAVGVSDVEAVNATV